MEAARCLGPGRLIEGVFPDARGVDRGGEEWRGGREAASIRGRDLRLRIPRRPTCLERSPPPPPARPDRRKAPRPGTARNFLERARNRPRPLPTRARTPSRASPVHRSARSSKRPRDTEHRNRNARRDRPQRLRPPTSPPLWRFPPKPSSPPTPSPRAKARGGEEREDGEGGRAYWRAVD